MLTFLKKAILITLFLVACQPINPDQIIPTITPSLPSSPTETFIPTQLIEVSPPTTSTPLEQNPQFIELPRWVRYSFPGGVLALPYGDPVNGNPSKMVFVNPNDGEKFFFDLMNEYFYYYWEDSEHIVFFHDGACDSLPKYISVLNLKDGNFQRYMTETYSGKIVPCYFHPDDEIVRLIDNYPERIVEYVDLSSGEVVQLTDPDDGITDISIQLSRYKNFLAVVQFDGDFIIPEEVESVYGNMISIYDLGTRQLILQYREEQGILAEVSFVSSGDLVYMRENTPCLIMILSKTKKCIHNIPNKFPDSTIILSQHAYHDGVNLRFLQFSNLNGGYCFYHLFYGESGCITDRFSVFHDQYVINYSISYYGHYLLIEYASEGCPVLWCDYPENTYLALSNQEGEIFELGPSDIYYISSLFRPLRPNPWQPWQW